VRVEQCTDPDAQLLIGDDEELILEVWSATAGELQEIARRVNAYDGLVELLRELAECGGSETNVASAEVLAARVRAAAVAMLHQLKENES